MITLDDINMKYVTADMNEELYNGAVLECSVSWPLAELHDWLPELDIDSLDTVQDWLYSEPHIAEGMYLKVWVD